jgi:uncharacterized repeat protein (TIGR01451 family)
MKKLVSISLLLVSSVLIFVSSGETKRTSRGLFAVADLAVTNVDSPDPVNTGSTLTYTITVTNNGPDAATNASWSDTLPTGTTFVSQPAVGGWSCTTPDAGDNGIVNCTNPSFAVGSAVFSLTVRVAPSVPAGSTITNSATATSSTPDGNPGNETGTATTAVRSPAVVTGNKFVSGGTSPGTNAEYLIILGNSSGSDQQDNPGNEFTDVLSSDLTLVSASASAGTATATIGTNTVTWNGVVPAGDSVTISITATIKPGTTGNTISNQGAISYDADGNGTNETNTNTNSVNFMVTAAGTNADLSVTKVASADTISDDSDISYTITVTNGGPDTATSATLSDPLPADMTFVSLTKPAGWTCTPPLTPGSGGTLTCSRDLPAGSGPQVFTLVGHVPSGTSTSTYTNIATVSTTATDATPENNSATAGTDVGCITDPLVLTNADSGAGSLRQAIKDACTGSKITFDMSAGHVTSPITLTTAELLINKNLTLAGPGANVLTVMRSTAGATPSFRIFNVSSGTVNMSGLTISNGNASTGGGILNQGTLRLIGCAISGNNAPTSGGGIQNGSGGTFVTLNIIDSTISGNTSASFGAGINNEGFSGTATLSIVNSTISGNSAPSFGGGIYNDANTGTATLDITNSTISGNTASSSGGGIYNFGNTGTGTITVRNTIISDNKALNASNGPDIFNSAGTVSGSNNVIQTSTGYTITGSSNFNVDPLLEKNGSGILILKNNGGPTLTLLPLPGSPAINAGSAANLPADTFDVDGDSDTAEALPIDQRGFARIIGANPDIGAVETNYTIAATAGTPQSAVINAAFATALQTTVKESGNNQNGVAVTYAAPLSGASGTFSGPATVNTNTSGIATAPTFTANGIAGSYNVTASIGSGSPSVNFALTNLKAATATALTSSVNPSSPGQSVTFTATVTSVAGTPTGTVQFKDGGTSLGAPQSLSGGVATFATSSLSAGTHAITADYSGDANFNSSTGTLSGGQIVGAVVQFSAAVYNTTESSRVATITVQRLGDPAPAFTVDYATPDDSAATPTIMACSTPGFVSPRCDFTTAIGTLRFGANETSKTFDVLISQDNFVEGTESVPLTLSNISGNAILGSQSSASLAIADDVTEPAANPIDDSQNFVRQQYHDFLNREPVPTDQAGFDFWVNQIESCGVDQACRDLRTINVSAAFFLSIEFQQTGFYVYRTYKTAFADINRTVPVPVRYREFIRDTREVQTGVIVGQGAWQAQLDANKQAYAVAFVTGPEFVSRYPLITSATQFVDSLNANAGNVLTPSERSALISELSPSPSDPALRGDVLMKIAENGLLKQAEMNRSFVLMQYFGYLRRNPDAAPEAGLNFNGYNFWLNKLNSFNGNFVNADMVKAFITSTEYRKRSGQ